MSLRLRLIDLDGSLPQQPLLQRAIASGSAERIDARDLGGRLRLWCSERAYAAMRARLHESAAPVSDGVTVSLLGSGDYHHLTPLLLEAEREPFSLIHFDNHPDWMRWAPRRHCGSWINRALELPMLQRVVTLGPCSDDLRSGLLARGNLQALNEGRLELHPWSRPPVRVPRGLRAGAGHERRGKELHWQLLRGVAADDFFAALAQRLPTARIWISIDKDVLRREDAISNWDQGEMPLDFLLAGLRVLASQRQIVGVDICGEYAPLQHRNWLKRFEAWRDQPREQRGAPPPDLQRNADTNARLLQTLAEGLS